jgi:HEAT repeat protein
VNRLARLIWIAVFSLTFVVNALAQTKSFTPVDGPNLKAKIESAITLGRNNAPGGRFWVAYQFEVRPGVAIDFEIVDGNGSVYWSMDGTSLSRDSRYETRELGLFFLFDLERELFTRAEVYNLQRRHEFSGYPVYWAGRASNEESLSYLSSIVDSPSPEMRNLADRAAFAIALHDDARVESILIELIRKPVSEQTRSKAIWWLGYTPESQSKNSFLATIVRNASEGSEARQQAMSALGMSRAGGTLPLLENLYETMTSRELKRRALSGIARNDNSDGAATYLIRVAENETETELRKSAIAALGRIAGEKSLGALTSALDSDPNTEIQKQAVVAIGRRPKDEAIPILIRTARTHPKMQVRKQAIQTLGQTGDERVVAFFKELLGK